MNPMQPVIDNAINEAIKQASPRGYEAILLVVLMVGLIAMAAMIVRWLIKSMDKRLEESSQREKGMREDAATREARMAVRLNELELFVQTTLVKIIDESSAITARVMDAVKSLSSALDRRPCLLPERENTIDKDARLRQQLADSHTKKGGDS